MFIFILLQIFVFSTEVEKITTQMSEQVHEERGLCLRYERDGDRLVINDYMIPKTFTTNTHSVVSHPCPEEYPITWHSHNSISIISTELQKYYNQATGLVLKGPEQMLYLSSGDIKYALYYRPEYMMVQVSGNQYAWWHISQIEHGDIILPIKDQVYLEK